MLEGAACVPNIGSRERRRRLVGGTLALVGSAALLWILVLTGAPRWGRLLVALPLWSGVLGLLQAREKT